MLYSPRNTLFLICLILIISILPSCGGPSERIKEIEAVKATPSPTPGERPISGSFVITGSAANGMEPYTGSLTVAPKGDNYEFRWSTTKGSRIGTGVQMGNAVAVSFAKTGGGKGCGVVVYKIASDGSLDGKSADWGYDLLWTETAVRTEGTSFAGKYEVSGINGRPYKGTLTIAKDGTGYDFDWKLINDEEFPDNHVGFGIWKGSVAAASFGGRQCSFALYDITSNGSLDGDWGGQAAVTFGKESAKRQ